MNPDDLQNYQPAWKSEPEPPSRIPGDGAAVDFPRSAWTDGAKVDSQLPEPSSSEEPTSSSEGLDINLTIETWSENSDGLATYDGSESDEYMIFRGGLLVSTDLQVTSPVGTVEKRTMKFGYSS